MPAPPFEAPTKETKTYTGCCHCQATKFTIELPSFEAALYCNCSYCITKDILWADAPPASLNFEREGPVTDYEFGKSLTFKFCSTCGNFIYGRFKADGKMSINTRLLEDVNFAEIKKDPFYDMASKPPHRNVPAYTGPEFDSSELNADKKLYLGHCHCGAVTYRMLTKPLEERMVNACDCSWCGRWGAIHMYPASHEVHIGGAEKLSGYDKVGKYGPASMKFCGTCGDQLFICSDQVPKDANGNEIENQVERLGYKGSVHCVNARLLEGLKWENIKVNPYPGRDSDPPYQVR